MRVRPRLSIRSIDTDGMATGFMSVTLIEQY